MVKEPGDIDEALERFVYDPQRFREQLRDVNGLITGGFALSFMAGTLWPESDLDVCIQKDKGQALADYLVNVEGYDFASSKIGAYHWGDVEKVYAYDRPTPAGPNAYSKIELVFTRGEPIRSVFVECYTTALINVITYNAAYSLFPIPTFRDKLTYSLKEPDYFHNVLLRKYQTRGYKDVQRPPKPEEDRTAGGCFSKKIRYVGDEFTWKVALPGVTSCEVPSNIEKVGFEIQEGRHVEDGLKWMVLQPLD